MKGYNTLRLNQATIMLAVQEYIDRRLDVTAERQKVTAVNYEPSTTTFSVNVEEIVDKVTL